MGAHRGHREEVIGGDEGGVRGAVRAHQDPVYLGGRQGWRRALYVCQNS